MELPLMKTIPGFSNYTITKNGRVWSKPRIDRRGAKRKGKWLKPWADKKGYLCLELREEDTESFKMVHHLVLETYIGYRPDGTECRHLNDIKNDNRLDNLCWGTRSENQQDSIRNGTHSCLSHGSQRSNSKLTEDMVRVIRYLRDVAKFSYADLAWQFDVAKGTIWNVCKRKRWTHI